MVFIKSLSLHSHCLQTNTVWRLANQMRRVKLGYSIGSLHKYSSWAGVDLCRVPLWQIISAREGVQLVLCCYVLKMELTRRANSQIWHEWWLGGFWNYLTHPFSAHCQLNSQWDICSKLVTHKCVCALFEGEGDR